MFLWKTASGGLYAGQLYGGHRHHSQGVWGSLHPGEEYNGKIPPTALWTGLSFSFWSTIFFTYFQWQVWAADDYEIFKRMMIQKNIDLQMEALELLQQRFPLKPTSNPTPFSWHPGMESFLSPSNLQKSLLRLQWKGRTRWCRRWPGWCKIKSFSTFQQPHICWQNAQSTKFKDIEIMQ